MNNVTLLVKHASFSLNIPLFTIWTNDFCKLIIDYNYNLFIKHIYKVCLENLEYIIDLMSGISRVSRK